MNIPVLGEKSKKESHFVEVWCPCRHSHRFDSWNNLSSAPPLLPTLWCCSGSWELIRLSQLSEGSVRVGWHGVSWAHTHRSLRHSLILFSWQDVLLLLSSPPCFTCQWGIPHCVSRYVFFEKGIIHFWWRCSLLYAYEAQMENEAGLVRGRAGGASAYK